MFKLLKKGGNTVVTRVTTAGSPNSFISQNQLSTSKSVLPAKPKRPAASSYARFVSQEFANYQKQHELAKASAVMAGLSAQWRSLDSDSKQKYNLAKEDYQEQMRIYEREHAEFLANLTSEEREKLLGRKVRKKLSTIKKEIQLIEESFGKPKRVPSATALFVLKIAESNPSAKIDLISGVKSWTSLPAEEKQKFYDLRQMKKEEYEKSRADFEKRLAEDTEASKKLKMLKEERKRILRSSVEDSE